MSAATISDCGIYRYSLSREWLGGDGTVLFVMLNPSTADASVDDPTIRRCIGFAQRWGYARLTVGNLYAYRATDPRELDDAAGAGVDPVGPENDDWLLRLSGGADEVIAAWGTKASAAREARVLRRLAPWCTINCLGTTKSGQPKHPLYLPNKTRRVPWVVRGSES